jgi:glycosyltransferase involved in cell wall biosynthesis
MSKMKILLLCNKSPWPPKDGGAAAILSTIKGLLECKAAITVLSFNTMKHFANKSEVPPEYSKTVKFHFVNIDTTVKPQKLVRNLIFSNKPYSIKRFESSEYEKKLTELLKNDFDIVQVEGLALVYYLPIIRNRTTAKIVFRPHNVESTIWTQLAKEEYNPFRKFYFKILSGRIRKAETEIINDFDGVAAITSVDLEWFRSKGLLKPSVVIPPGVDINIPKENQVINSSAIFFIGSLDWLPNINGLKWFVRKVWPSILKAVPGVSFSIAGRNATGNILRFLKRVNLPFSGEVPASSGFMTDKSVMVVPLFSGSGIRMRIIEGMSFGKSIVTTSRGAEGLDYEDKRDLFIADTREDFADRVIDLLKNTQLMKQTGINAVENVRKNYNILASAGNLLKFYSELTA